MLHLFIFHFRFLLYGLFWGYFSHWVARLNISRVLYRFWLSILCSVIHNASTVFWGSFPSFSYCVYCTAKFKKILCIHILCLVYIILLYSKSYWCSSTLSYKRLTILFPIFKSLIHLEFICVCCEIGIQFYFFAFRLQLVSASCYFNSPFVLPDL